MDTSILKILPTTDKWVTRWFPGALLLTLANLVSGEPLNPQAVAKAGAIIAEGFESNWNELIWFILKHRCHIQHLLSQELLIMWWTCSVAVAAGLVIFNITYWFSKSMNDQYWHMCVHCAHILDTLKIKIFQILWCEDLCPGHTASLQADHQDPVQD